MSNQALILGITILVGFFLILYVIHRANKEMKKVKQKKLHTRGGLT